jgi:GTPase SAR1 family protein
VGIDLLNLKTHEPVVALDNFFWLVAGVGKSGKTTLFARLVEKYFGDVSKGLIIGFEHGYSALRVNAVDINNWDDFEEVVEQLVDNKDQLPYRFIGLDTVDIMLEMAQDKVIQEWNRENPAKRTKDIDGVGAKGTSNQGFGVGYNRAKKKIRNTIDKLQKSGFGIMAITHSKDKEVEEKNGIKYDQLVCSLPQSARDIFINMADFICFITIEKEKSGNEVTTNRYIYMRSDGYVEAGSRFKNVPVRIPYDVDQLISSFKEAVRSEYDSDKQMQKAHERQQQEKEQRVQEFLQHKDDEPKTDEPTANEVIEEINQLIDAMKPITPEQKQQLTVIFTQHLNMTNYKKSTDVAALQKCVVAINQM